MSKHSAPIVSTILFVADQRHPWKLATIDRFVVAYHTSTTVRVGTKGGTTRHQHQVYCIADDAAWERVQATQANLQAALDALAAGLRTLGSYAFRLAAAGGIKTAPNPLCFTVISAPDPDLSDEGSWFTNRLVPRIERGPLTEHTPKMLRRPSAYDGSAITFSQRDHFVCPDDAAWARIEALIMAAKAAELNWATVLVELGKYSEALADGRYTRPIVIPQLDLRGPSIGPARAGVRPVGDWSETDIDDAFIARLESAGYHWEIAKQTLDGRWHHVISARNTALLRNDQVLLRRDRLEALLTPKPIAQEPTVQAIDRAIRENDTAALAQVAAAPPAFGGRHFDSYAQAGNNALIPLGSIRIDGGTQARSGLNEATVAEYREARDGGAVFPPVVLFYDGKDYWLADGFHRVAACDRDRYPAFAIPADVRQGTRRDAVLYAAGANAEHGLRRSKDDVRRAVEVLLRDAEWIQWSDREIARRCKVDHKTVGAHRTRLARTGELPSVATERKAADGRTMNTSGIAAANAQRAEPAPAAPAPALSTPATDDGLVRYPDTAAVQARLRPHGWYIQAHHGANGSLWLVRVDGSRQSKCLPNWPAVIAFADQLDGITPAPTAPIPPALAARAKAVGLNVWITSLSGGGYQTGQDKGATNYTTYATLADLEAAIVSREAPAPITPESRDADGPWFWASKSVVHPTAHCWNVRPLPSGAYVAACGLEMPIQPTSGAKGVHCSVCETHADRRSVVPIPGIGPAPITVQTRQGPREVVPLQTNGVLALHPSTLGNSQIITHITTGKAIAQFAQSASATAAYAQLRALDWQLLPEGGIGPALGLAISRIVTQFDDVDHYEQRLTKLKELEAAAQPTVMAQSAIEPDPRAQIAALLLQLAPLLKDLTTEDQLGLADAINELNACQEGSEPEYWLNVGWALLDLVPESAVAQ